MKFLTALALLLLPAIGLPAENDTSGLRQPNDEEAAKCKVAIQWAGFVKNPKLQATGLKTLNELVGLDLAGFPEVFELATRLCGSRNADCRRQAAYLVTHLGKQSALPAAMEDFLVGVMQVKAEPRKVSGGSDTIFDNFLLHYFSNYLFYRKYSDLPDTILTEIENIPLAPIVDLTDPELGKSDNPAHIMASTKLTILRLAAKKHDARAANALLQLAKEYPTETGLAYGIPAKETCDFAAYDFTKKILPMLAEGRNENPSPFSRSYDFSWEPSDKRSAISMLVLRTSDDKVHLPTVRALARVVQSKKVHFTIRHTVAYRFLNLSKTEVYSDPELASVVLDTILAVERKIQPTLGDLNTLSLRAKKARLEMEALNKQAIQEAESGSNKFSELARDLRMHLGLENGPTN